MSPPIILPNNQIVRANMIGTLNLHKDLSNKAKRSLIVPQLSNESLISVGQLCDDDCIVKVDKNKVDIIKNNKLMYQGQRNKIDGL